MEKVRLFESFAGIGTQRMALERLGIPYESVGVSEIDESAILSYAAIHEDLKNIEFKNNITDKEKQDYLKKINAPLDAKTFKNKVGKLKGKRLDNIYKANIVSKNYGDISKIDAKDLPDMDLFTYSFPCFTGDSLVLTKKGYKEIKNIKVGDYVLTHDNTYKKVVNVFNNGLKDTILLKSPFFGEINTTLNHKFYAKDNLEEKPKWIEVKDIKKDTYLSIAVNKNEIIPSFKNLNEVLSQKDFWWIMGKYFRKGSFLYPSKVIIKLNDLEFKQFIKKSENILNYKYERKDDLFLVEINNKDFINFITQFKNGEGKIFTNDIIDLPKDLLDSFLKGFFDVYKEYETKNKKLIYALAQIIYKTYNCKVIIDSYSNQNNKIIYTLKYEKSNIENYDGNYIWFKGVDVIKHIKNTVYDIEVEDNHSFTVNNTIVHNCQDISSAGLQKGFKKGSKTRSGLLWECEKIIKEKKPKYLLMENVKALTFKKNIKGFLLWLDILEKYGYKNFWQVLNAKDYGVPQSRQRIFCISILDKDIDYTFPEPITLNTRIKDILEDNVDEKYYLNDSKNKVLFKELSKNYDFNNTNTIRQIGKANTNRRRNPSEYRVYHKDYIAPTLLASASNKTPYIIDKFLIDQSIKNPKIKDVSNALTTQDRGLQKRSGEGNAILEINKEDKKIRKLTPLECWRLMGIDDKDFYKAKEYNSNTQLYKQAGNAIVVDVLYYIFGNIFKEN
jgi:modification methylase scrFIB